MSKKPKLVRVTWHDAYTNDEGWQNFQDKRAITPCVTETVGFLIERTRAHIMIAPTANNTEQFSTYWVIPLGCVRTVRTIRQGAR